MSITMMASGSSAFLLYGYDESSQRLKIEFNSGQKIIYKEVPLDEWKAFQLASSKGKHYNVCIKGVYQVNEEATVEANK